MKQIQIAKKFLGQSELSGNRFKDDPNIKGDLGELLIKAGQKDGEAWCAYFMEAVFCEAYPEREREFRRLFSANCLQTLENFEKAGYQTSLVPVVGALAVYVLVRRGVETKSGHIGLVTDVLRPTQHVNIEGNTTKAGSREGTTVLGKTRTLAKQTDGLQLKKFIIIP